jgi:tRNA threonylcarbamoyladenosine biosynthesis protein TsaB
MKLLAIETATDACSVALQPGGALVERCSSEPRVHAALVLEMVHECLGESALGLSDLDLLVFGCGPGSFTGVRIATAVIQGLAFGSDLLVVPVSTLAGHAVACWRQTGATRIAVAVDARMDECYWGLFSVDSEGVARSLDQEKLTAPGVIPVPEGKGWTGAGSGWREFPLLSEAMEGAVDRMEPAVLPLARDLLATGSRLFAECGGVPAHEALPVYLRESVAWQGGR